MADASPAVAHVSNWLLKLACCNCPLAGLLAVQEYRHCIALHCGLALPQLIDNRLASPITLEQTARLFSGH